MSLELTVDSLEGLDESVQSLYVEKDGKFKLDVSGIDDGAELKGALGKEREARKEAERKLKAEQQKKDDLEKATLEEKEQWKELADKYKSENSKLHGQIVGTKIDSFTDRIVNNLTKDDKKGKILKNEISKHLEFLDGVIVIKGLAGVDSRDGLQEHFKENYAFLVDGSKASGGGAAGNRGGGAANNTKSEEQVNAMNPAEKMTFFKGGGQVKD